MQITTALFLLLLRLHNFEALRLEECDAHPLGMQDGRLSDSQISASSSFDKQSVGPHNARLHSEFASGAWCPKPQINSKSYEYLQISLNNTFLITGVETQGRYGNGTGREYPSEYMIDYMRNGSQWIRYRNRTGHVLMTGNFDTTTPVIRTLDPPIVASKIRIVPASKSTRTVCLRAEIHGCKHHGPLYYVTVPDGSRQDSLDFKDPIFEDSQMYTESGIKRGLGLLTDGYSAQTSPFDSNQKNASWIGWNRDTTDGQLTMMFEFEEIHNFTDVVLATFGNRIDRIEAIFSQDGKTFPLYSQITSSERQTANSTSRRYDFRVPLHSRCGKKVRISIKFSSDWIFLTEVHFNSALNQTSSVVQVAATPSAVPKIILVACGLLFIFLLVCVFGCVTQCMKKQKNKNKKIEKNLKKDLIITHIGNKPTCHIFPSNKSTRGSFEVANDFYYAKSQKSTLLSVSSKNSSSLRQVPPTWNDFNFPPPPEDLMVAQDGPIYCQPLTPENSSSSGTSRSSKSSTEIKKYPASSLMLGVLIGEGKFTKIKECIIFGGVTVAHKSLKDQTSAHGRRILNDEIKMLMKCGKHPNVVELLAIDEHCNLLLEYMEMGSIRNFLIPAPTPLEEGILQLICREVCRAMEHFEMLGIVHGHLTPSSILFQHEFDVKVCAPRGPIHHAQLRYSSPESILNDEFTPKSDVWSFATCVWEMSHFCRLRPFEHFTNEQIVVNAAAIQDNLPNAEFLHFPKVFEDKIIRLLDKCFNPDPSRRPSFSELLKIFKL